MPIHSTTHPSRMSPSCPLRYVPWMIGWLSDPESHFFDP